MSVLYRTHVLGEDGKVLRETDEAKDIFFKNRRALLLWPGATGKDRKLLLGESLEAVEKTAGGKIPHHLPAEAVRVEVTGPLRYSATYSVVKLDWENTVTAPVPENGSFPDYACQPWKFHVLYLGAPWKPGSGYVSTLIWKGYGLAEPLPKGLTFEEGQRFVREVTKSIDGPGFGNLLLLENMFFAVVRKVGSGVS